MELGFVLFALSAAWTAAPLWVYCDTKVLGINKGIHTGFPDFGPGGWFLFMLLALPVAFPVYMHKRAALAWLARQARAKAAT